MSLPFIFARRAPRVLPSFTNATPHLMQQWRRNSTMHIAPPQSVPPLNNIGIWAEEGVKGVFSKRAFDTAWTNYQRGLVDNLNRLIGGTEYANMTPLDIAVVSARQADLAAVFNYASQAHNNHFFFEGLSSSKVPVPESIMTRIPFGFASEQALRTELLTTASKMFGNGWVWLVLDQNRYLRILCTYNAGTPYGAAYRRQDTDLNTRETLGDVNAMTDSIRQSTQGSNSNWAIPLLNINCWEHAWLEDFGINGKDRYLEAVWEAIDWNVVASRCPVLYRDGTPSLRRPFSR